VPALVFLSQAKEYKQAHKPAEKVPLFTDCAGLGRTYGVGLGLYFKCMQWMRVLFLWLTLTTVRGWVGGWVGNRAARRGGG
jgi:hypothetical protein